MAPALGPGIDVRGPGRRNSGYLIGPGVVGGIRYAVERDLPVAPLPNWIADFLVQAPRFPEPVEVDNSDISCRRAGAVGASAWLTVLAMCLLQSPRRAAVSQSIAAVVGGNSRDSGGRERSGAGEATGSVGRRLRAAAAVLAFLLAVAGTQAVGSGAAGAAVRGSAETGFSAPFAGAPRFEGSTPTEVSSPSWLNRPLGQKRADEIAVSLGLRKAEVFTRRQYLEFVSGRGVGGDPSAAALVDASVRILTNTTGRPLYSVVAGVVTPTVLASYGLFVTRDGWLESPAYATAPTRRVNEVIAPGGYMGTWMRANGATASLRMLYRSAFPVETAYGFVAQQISGQAQLVTNTKGGTCEEVGMSMAPALWATNFALIYTLNPALAADMPARWAPIPQVVADAILASPTGRVRYADYASALR